MGEMPKRIIYWVGGLLSQDEREKEYIPYGSDLQKVFNKVTDNTSGYTFVSVSKCTKKRFFELWSDQNTYGIVWYSHGAAVQRGSELEVLGYPVAFDRKNLNPFEKLPKPGRNLKFVVFKSCGSAKLKDEWEQNAPGVKFVMHQGSLFSYTWDFLDGVKWRYDQMKKWINGWWLTAPKPIPEYGAKYLFELLPPIPKDEPIIYPSGGVGPSDAGVPSAQVKEGLQEEQGLLNYLDTWLGQQDKLRTVTAAVPLSNEKEELLNELGDWLGVQPIHSSGGFSNQEKGLLSNLGNWLHKEDEKQQEWMEQMAHRQQEWSQEEQSQYQEWINGRVQQDRDWIKEERDHWGNILQVECEGLLSDLSEWCDHENERQLSLVHQQQEAQFAWIEQLSENQHDRLQHHWLRDWRQDWQQKHHDLSNPLTKNTESLSDLEEWLKQRGESLDQQRNQTLSWIENHHEEQHEWLQQSRQQQNIWLNNLREHQQDWLHCSLQDYHEGNLSLDQWYSDFTQQQQQWQQNWQQQQQQWQQNWQQQFWS